MFFSKKQISMFIKQPDEAIKFPNLNFVNAILWLIAQVGGR